MALLTLTIRPYYCTFWKFPVRFTGEVPLYCSTFKRGALASHRSKNPRDKKETEAPSCRFHFLRPVPHTWLRRSPPQKQHLICNSLDFVPRGMRRGINFPPHRGPPTAQVQGTRYKVLPLLGKVRGFPKSVARIVWFKVLHKMSLGSWEQDAKPVFRLFQPRNT
jgi:hypothetical protein